MTVYKAKARFQDVPPKYKIFYGDGSTYSNKTGPPERAPKRNVQAITVEDDVIGRRIEATNDYYIYTTHSWRGCDNFGLFDYLIEPGVKLVLFGRSLSDSEYKAIRDVATKDPYLPAKSAIGINERN